MTPKKAARFNPAGHAPGVSRSAWQRVRSALALPAVLVAALASAQPAAAPEMVVVKSGETFSSIAAQFTGNLLSWSKLYDKELSGLPDPNRVYPGQRFELVKESGGKSYLRVVGGGTAQAAAAPRVASAAPAPAKPAPSPGAVPAPAQPAAATELVVGVLPNISASTLMSQYESLKSYLERQNGQKVRIVLPANFKAFFEAMMRGEYDLAVSAPHFARVAQLDAKLVPLVMYEPRIEARFITPIDAPLPTVKDLKGKALAFANPTSLVAMYGTNWLRSQGLESGRDYEVKSARTDMGVGRMLLSGDVSAAIMSNGEFRSLPPEESARLKIVEVFARIPNFIVMGHPRLGGERLAQLKLQWLGFLADKDDGAAFAKATGIRGIVNADEATLMELDPYTATTRRVMGVGN